MLRPAETGAVRPEVSSRSGFRTLRHHDRVSEATSVGERPFHRLLPSPRAGCRQAEGVDVRIVVHREDSAIGDRESTEMHPGLDGSAAVEQFLACHWRNPICQGNQQLAADG